MKPSDTHRQNTVTSASIRRQCLSITSKRFQIDNVCQLGKLSLTDYILRKICTAFDLEVCCLLKVFKTSSSTLNCLEIIHCLAADRKTRSYHQRGARVICLLLTEWHIYKFLRYTRQIITSCRIRLARNVIPILSCSCLSGLWGILNVRTLCSISRATPAISLTWRLPFFSGRPLTII